MLLTHVKLSLQEMSITVELDPISRGYSLYQDLLTVPAWTIEYSSSQAI